MQEYKRPRRYYLLERKNARTLKSAFEPFWQSKQEAEPGTALPSDFVQHTQLASVGYTTVEDLDGADERELTDAGLSSREAKAVLEALTDLLP